MGSGAKTVKQVFAQSYLMRTHWYKKETQQAKKWVNFGFVI